MKSGYAYKRWRKGTDVELLKKANSFHVSKLRTIVLFEVDFNFNNKVVGKKVGTRAEAHHGMAKEQGGSRKNHRTVKIGHNKCLTMDQLQQLKWPGILCSHNMKSCYDRILHAVASLSLQ
jgi:thymidylate kinase